MGGAASPWAMSPKEDEVDIFENSSLIEDKLALGSSDEVEGTEDMLNLQDDEVDSFCFSLP